jgi:glycosyltransferase involved in cell wall biosynthesis
MIHMANNMRKRILIDVTNINHDDSGTGIQRVIRNICREMVVLAESEGVCIVPVALQRIDDCIQLCHATALNAKINRQPIEKGVVVIEENDTLLMIDCGWFTVNHYLPFFEKLHQKKGTLITTIYDTIPIDFPQFCQTEVIEVFGPWMFLSSQHSDCLICISKDVANRVSNVIQRNQWPFQNKTIGFMHLGSNIDTDINRSKQRSQERNVENTGGNTPLTRQTWHDSRRFTALNATKLSERKATNPLPFNSDIPLFLIVSTLEPRKGHAVILDAFERLWEKGVDAQLCLIGKQGWLMDAFCARIRNHVELGKRLFWGGNISDEVLLDIYQSSKALLYPSVIEGFGLGIVEAARFNIPVICSDIPVFREIAEGGALFVEQANVGAWADAVELVINGPWPYGKIQTMTWQDTALQLLDFINNPTGAQMVYAT